MINFLPVNSDINIQKVVDLANVIWPQHYIPIIGSAQVDYMLDKFQDYGAVQSQLADDYNYFIIQYNEQAVGYLSYLLDDKALFLSKFYVLRDYQGRGFGNNAMNFIKEKAESRRIWLTVNKMNTGSIHFYEKQGLSIVDAVVTEIGGGYFMDDFVMEAL